MTSEITPVRPNIHTEISFGEKKPDEDSQIERLDNVESGKPRDLSIEAAAAAELAEQSMTFREAVRDYRKAILWSMAISLCIIMEGVDTAFPVSGTRRLGSNNNQEIS